MTDDDTLGNPSELPPIATLARQIRNGSTADRIAKRCAISRNMLQHRFNIAGYSMATGEPLVPRRTRKITLKSAHLGAGGPHVGGGDWDRGLPAEPVRYRGKPRQQGLDWGGLRDSYVANGGVEQPEVYAAATRRTRKPDTLPAVEREPLSKADRAEIARRYAGGESTKRLADAYDASTKAIRNAVIANGGAMRTLAEAAAIRRPS